MDFNKIIKRPLITEKSTILSESGVYTFEVTPDSTKTEIKSAIEKAFEVNVMSVRTLIGRNRGKRTKAGYSMPKYQKKAFVRLKPGESIKIFEGGAE